MNKYEEAIDVMARFISDCKLGIKRYCDREIDTAMANIVELGDKATSKKPNLEGDGYWNGELVYDTWFCPCCGKDYEVDYDKYDYCPNCGQHIDWSDSDDE